MLPVRGELNCWLRVAGQLLVRAAGQWSAGCGLMKCGLRANEVRVAGHEVRVAGPWSAGCGPMKCGLRANEVRAASHEVRAAGHEVWVACPCRHMVIVTLFWGRHFQNIVCNLLCNNNSYYTSVHVINMWVKNCHYPMFLTFFYLFFIVFKII